MIRNQHYFAPPARTDTYLRVRGFDPSGQRSGGIKDPVEVLLPASTILFRLFHKPNTHLGEWWFTAFEMSQVVSYFARSGPAFAVGRAQGQGILHATLAVRHDWSNDNPLHLAQFVVIRLNEPLKAYYGEGDHAPDSSQTRVQKAIRIIDAKGVQRCVRQVFIPELWRYPVAITDLGHHPTDTVLLGAVEKYRRPPLPFER